MNAKIDLSVLRQYRPQNKKFAAITCYDYTMGRLVGLTDIEMVLVGDSAAEFALGYKNTLPVTMDFMLAITAAVRRAVPERFLVADMPFLSYQTGIADAIKNSGRFLTDCDADIVKFEVTLADLEMVRAVANANIPVMAHLGIRPQTAALGKLKAQGTDQQGAQLLLETAEKMIEAGARMLLLEGVATQTAAKITQASPVPVVSCGSGSGCDGQVLVIPDVLGLNPGAQRPKFSKSFGDVGQAVIDALNAYSKEVHAGTFPDDAHSYHLKA